MPYVLDTLSILFLFLYFRSYKTRTTPDFCKPPRPFLCFFARRSSALQTSSFRVAVPMPSPSLISKHEPFDS